MVVCGQELTAGQGILLIAAKEILARKGGNSSRDIKSRCRVPIVRQAERITGGRSVIEGQIQLCKKKCRTIRQILLRYLAEAGSWIVQR